MSSTPCFYFKFASLEKLYLNDNDLREVPDEVFRLKMLTHLYLKGRRHSHLFVVVLTLFKKTSMVTANKFSDKHFVIKVTVYKSLY